MFKVEEGNDWGDDGDRDEEKVDRCLGEKFLMSV